MRKDDESVHTAPSESASKRGRYRKEVNRGGTQPSKGLLSVMGTLAHPPNYQKTVSTNNSSNTMSMEQIQARRRLSGGIIESYLVSTSTGSSSTTSGRTDDMDTDSVVGRPRSMSF